MRGTYLCPSTGHQMNGRAARRALRKLADRLDALECHDRARYVRTEWRTVATSTGLWGSLLALVSSWEGMRRKAS